MKTELSRNYKIRIDFINFDLGLVWWLQSVIAATWEAEIWKIAV
jgi:hypothetical protein